jgi:hypothetical protein
MAETKQWVLFFNAPNRGNEEDDEYVNKWVIGHLDAWANYHTIDGNVFVSEAFESLDEAVTRLRELTNG